MLATHDNAAIFDLDGALQRLGGDEGLLREMAAYFIEDVPLLSRRLLEALERGDFDEVVRSAHSIKSLAANFDANQAHQAAFAVERAGRSRNAALLQDLVVHLMGAVKGVVMAMRAEPRLGY